MRVLQVNKFNHIRGGADKYFLEISDFLSKRVGCPVAKFCMSHEANFPSEWENYFVSYVDLNAKSRYESLRAAGRLLWSFEAAKKFDHLLFNFRPEIVHIHNIYRQISPSILPVAKRHNLPVVMHLHDYSLFSPDYNMFNQGRVDESSAAGNYWRAIAARSVKHSYAKSALASFEMYLHHKILQVYEKNIDIYIAPSEFMKNKAVEYGLDEARVKILPHFIEVKNYQPSTGNGKYLLYFGRLEREKGVDVLLEALHLVKNKDWRLKIVGDGSQLRHLRLMAKALGVFDQVEFVGMKHGEELKQIIRDSYMVVVPSVCYEVFGLVNLEAAASAKAVLASEIGGIPEIVKKFKTGLLFKPGSAHDLATKLEWALDNPREIREIGLDARHAVESHFTVRKHLADLVDIYKTAKNI